MKRPLLLTILTFIIVLFIDSKTIAQEFHWVRNAKASESNINSSIGGIAADNAGNSYTVGAFRGNATFGHTILNSDTYGSIYIAKHDTDGNAVWAKTLIATNNDARQFDVAVDPSGNSYFAGNFKGTVSIGAFTLTSRGGWDVVVVKLNSEGDIVWAQQAGGQKNDAPSEIAVDAQGNILVTGYFMGNASFGSTTLQTNDNPKLFIAKYKSSGELTWAKQAYGTGRSYGNGIATDQSNNVYITGYFDKTATLGSFSITKTGTWSTDFFLAKLNADGNPIWVVDNSGDESNAVGSGVTVDSQGNVFVAGDFGGSATFGNSTTLTGNGMDSGFVGKYLSDGSFSWVKGFIAVPSSISRIMSVATDNSGNIYATGEFSDEVIYGEISIKKNDRLGILLCRIDTQGNLIWLTNPEGNGWGEGNDVAVDSKGNAYFTGTIGGQMTLGSESITSSTHYDTFIAKLKGGVATGIKEEFQNPYLSVYPIPSRSSIFIDLSLPKAAYITTRIIDLQGRVISEKKYGKISALKMERLSLSDLTPGVYMLQMYIGDMPVYKRLIIE